jgi:hypothetical protein
MRLVESKGWSPYLAGALAGIVMILSVWIAGKYLGASTTFVRSAGMIEKVFSAERVKKMDYFIKKPPKVEWQWMFVFGIFLGSLISSATSRNFKWQALPDMWKRRFGRSKIKRGVTAFIGGIIAMFGARLAGG